MTETIATAVWTIRYRLRRITVSRIRASSVRRKQRSAVIISTRDLKDSAVV